MEELMSNVVFKNWGFFLLSAVLMSSGCQNSGAYTTSEEAPSELVEMWPDSLTTARERRAICVWPVVGLRREPGRKNYTSDRQKNYLVPIYYGERVEYLGVFDTVKSENRVYMRIRLQDGQEGWVNEELFEKNGRLAAMTQEAEIYRRPDLMTLRDDKVLPGEIIVVLERKDDWVHISGYKKASKGWIKLDRKFTFEQDDLMTALRLFKADQTRNPEVKRDRLQEILDDKALKKSQLIELVKQRMDNIGTADPSSIPSNIPELDEEDEDLGEMPEEP